MPRQIIAFSLLTAAALLTGCSSVIRGTVDTQPRVALSKTSFQSPDEIVHGRAVMYQPAERLPANGADRDLELHRWAPRVVQGFQPQPGSAEYPYWSDGIGQPMLNAAGDGVVIDPAEPVVFSRIEHCTIDGEILRQLVYAFWYPDRPVGSIERGDVDGGILRITLDDAGRPIVFEYSQPCGCFHGVFVSSELERDARALGMPIEQDRLFAIESPLTGETDWVVRDLIDVNPDARPVLYMSAGKHFCEAIRFTGEADLASLDVREYRLARYETLAAAPRQGGGEPASIFDERGLVIGGKRWKEELMLSDLEHPGWPRHLDAMRIHWDQNRWTDPTLLQQHLRVASVVGHSAQARAQSSAASHGSTERSPTIGNGRELLLFTNRSCAGCQIVKNDVMTNAQVQQGLRSWTYRVIDTAEPRGAALAASLRVTSVPTLVGFVSSRELFRTEDVYTPKKVVAVIQ